MKRSGILLGLLLLLIAVLLVVSARSQGASGSVLSSGPGGFSALRAAIEALGRDVQLVDRPLTEVLSAEEASGEKATQGAVLVISFPWQRSAELASRAAIEEHRLAGNPVVIAYSGGALAVAEEQLLSDLGFDMIDSFGFGPLNPIKWRQELRQPQPLSFAAPDASPSPAASQVSTQRLRRTPEETLAGQKGTSILLWDAEQGRPVAIEQAPRGLRGALYLVPASVLSNAHLGKEGNARFLVALAQRLPRRWLFDEYHHGLVGAGAARAETTGAFDAVVLQFSLIYVLALLALSRRFAPAWPPVVTHNSNHRDFLEGIGMLHAKMGHATEARARLLERYQRYDPSFRVTESQLRLAKQAVDDPAAAFLDLAQQLSRGQEK